MTPPARRLCLCAALALAPLLRAEPKLADASPFLPADGAGAAAAESTPLELRGIMQDGDGYRFSIYDPVKKSGQWVRLNEPGHDFTVKTHDVAGDAVTLDFQGRTLTLALHAAKVVALAPPAAPAADTGQYPAGPHPAGIRGRPATPEEQARFNRAVEEIARRRAAREHGTPPAPK